MPSFIGQIKFPRIEPLVLRMAEDYSNAWNQIYSEPAPAAQPQIYDQVFTQPVPTYNQPQTVQTTYVPAPVQNPSNPYWQTPAASPSPFLMQPAPWDSGVPGAPAPFDMFSPAPLDRAVPRTDPDTGKPYMGTDGVFAGLDPADMTEPVVDLNAPEAANQGVKPTIMVDGQLAPDWRQRMAASPDAKVEAGDAPPGDYAALTDDPRQPFMLAGSDEGKAPVDSGPAAEPADIRREKAGQGRYAESDLAVDIAAEVGVDATAEEIQAAVADNYKYVALGKASRDSLAAKERLESAIEARNALYDRRDSMGPLGQVKENFTRDLEGQIVKAQLAVGKAQARYDGSLVRDPKAYLESAGSPGATDATRLYGLVDDRLKAQAAATLKTELDAVSGDPATALSAASLEDRATVFFKGRAASGETEAIVQGKLFEAANKKVPGLGDTLRESVEQENRFREEQAGKGEAQARVNYLKAIPPSDRRYDAAQAELPAWEARAKEDTGERAFGPRLDRLERATADKNPALAEARSYANNLRAAIDGDRVNNGGRLARDFRLGEAGVDFDGDAFLARYHRLGLEKTINAYAAATGKTPDAVREFLAGNEGMAIAEEDFNVALSASSAAEDYASKANLDKSSGGLSRAAATLLMEHELRINKMQDVPTLGEDAGARSDKSPDDFTRVAEIAKSLGKTDLQSQLTQAASAAARRVETDPYYDTARTRTAATLEQAHAATYAGRAVPKQVVGTANAIKSNANLRIETGLQSIKMQVRLGELTPEEVPGAVDRLVTETNLMVESSYADLAGRKIEEGAFGYTTGDGVYHNDYKSWAAVGGLLMMFLQPLERSYYRREDEKDKEKWWEKERAWEREKAQMQQDFWLERQGALEAGDDDDGGGGGVAGFRPARF